MSGIGGEGEGEGEVVSLCSNAIRVAVLELRKAKNFQDIC
jgi:hypothetical protein